MRRLVSSVFLGAFAVWMTGDIAAGQGTGAPMQQQMPPPAAAPQQIGQPCAPVQRSYPNAAQQLGAQYGPNQVYPGYLSGTGGMPGGTGIPGLGGTPGVGGRLPGIGGIPGVGGVPNVGDGYYGGNGNYRGNGGNGYYGGYGPQNNNTALNGQTPCPAQPH